MNSLKQDRSLVPFKSIVSNEDLIELKNDVYDLIARTAIELGHKTDGKTMAALSKIFTKDLQTDKRFKNLCTQDVDTALHLGVRDVEEKDHPFLNIRWLYKWLYKHKKRIDDATYNVETCGAEEEKELYYRKQKLLK